MVFVGTLQQKRKKNKGDELLRQQMKQEKLRSRTQHFYDAVRRIDPSYPLPHFDIFFQAFLEIKGVLDGRKDECYSWSEVLDRLTSQFQLPSLTNHYEHFLDEVPPPLYRKFSHLTLQLVLELH